MKLAKVTANGRVTIPTLLRQKYDLTPGRRVKFETTEDGIIIIPLATSEEIKANIGFLGAASRKPSKKGKLLKSLIE